MGVDELKKELESKGWLFEKPITKETGVSWQAYNRLSGLNDCEQNDRPPSLICTPYQFDVNGNEYRSVEFSVTGKTLSGLWINFLVYSVSMDDAINELPKATALLRAAWNSVSNLNTEGL